MIELILKRNERNKTFDLGKGVNRLVCYGSPIHYEKDGKWDDIDLDFQDDGIGNWISDKNKVSAGFRQDLKLEKYFGLRYDYEHQFEGTIKEIKLDNVEKISSDKISSLTKDSKTEIKQQLNNDIEIINRLTSGSLINFVKVSNPIEDFRIVEEIHLKGLICSNKKEQNILTKDGKITYISDEHNRFNFIDEKEELKFWINQPFFEDGSNRHSKEIQHSLEEIDGHLIYTKIPTENGKDDLLLAQYPISIDTNTYYSSTKDGYISKSDLDIWADTRSASSGGYLSDNDAYGANSIAGTSSKHFYIHRSFFYFDTSDLPTAASITAATFSLYGYGTSESAVSVQKGTQADTLTLADFDNFSGSEYGHVTWGTGAYKDISFNTQGKSDIQKDGTTKLCAREYTHDYSNSEPDTTYDNGCYYSDDTSSSPIRKPKLVITYTTSTALDVNVNDSITITEDTSQSVSVVVVDLDVSVNDAQSIAENTEQQLSNLDIGVSEDVNIADDPTILIGDNAINVNDYITFDEDILLTISDLPVLEIEVNDLISIDENISINIEEATELNINVLDSLEITEDISISISDLDLSKYDEINLTENVDLFIPFFNINIDDDISISEDETINIQATETLEININDTQSITENTTRKISESNININDDISINENTTQNISESNINIDDDISISEDETINIQATETLEININDTQSITENTTKIISDGNINVEDSISIDENIEQEITDIDIDISDSISITEYNAIQPDWCVVDAIVGDWKMNEASWDGTTGEIIDSTGHGHNGTSINGPDTIADGKLDRAGQLDGINNYLDLGNDSELNLTTGLSFELWARPHTSQEICYTAETGGNSGLAAKVESNESSTNWSWQLRYGSSDSCRLGFQAHDTIGVTKWVTAGKDLVNNEWCHIIVTFDGTNLRFYLDSELVDSEVLEGNIASYENNLLVGSEGWSNDTDYFDGDIDNVRLYDRALTPNEINALYNQGDGTEEVCSNIGIADYDKININEDINIDIIRIVDIDVNDSQSIIDNILITIDELESLEINVNDSLTIIDELVYYDDFITIEEVISIEVITPVVDLDITVNEDISIDEDISISINDLDLSKYDEINLTENVDLLIPFFNINIDDSINIDDDISIVIGGYSFSVNEDISISEYIELENSLTDIEVNDLISIDENISINIEEATELNINVLDSLEITEDIIVLIQNATELNIIVNDFLTIAEDITILIQNATELNIIINDSLTINGYIIQNISESNIGISEDITLNDDPTILFCDNCINISDYITLDENIERELTINPEINDYLTIDDNIKQLLDIDISIDDSISITELIQRELISLISINDSILINENVNSEITELNISISDDISINENIESTVAYVITIDDSVSITENVEILIVVAPDLDLEINDSVSITEYTALQFKQCTVYMDKANLFKIKNDKYTDKDNIYTKKSNTC